MARPAALKRKDPRVRVFVLKKNHESEATRPQCETASQDRPQRESLYVSFSSKEEHRFGRNSKSKMSFALIKQLRGATGARLIDCKAAVEATTSLDEAFTWLREKGASRAAKLETRTVAHGLVAARVAGGRGCLVEVNSETDFVARNAAFQRFVSDLADSALRNFATLASTERDAGGAALVGGDALRALDLAGTPVAEAVLALSAHVGERIDVRRCALVEGAVVSAYAHNGTGNAGTAAGVVALDGGDDDLGRKLAMHCVAARPVAIDVKGLPPSLLDAERAILEAQLADSPKPAAIVEKILQGQLAKFCEERTLLTQVHVVEGKASVGKVLRGTEVQNFAVFHVGK